MSKEADEAYERVKQRELEEGIDHEKGCDWWRSAAPLNECMCDCYTKWWFRQAITEGAELAAKEQLERMGYDVEHLNETSYRDYLKQAQELERENKKV